MEQVVVNRALIDQYVLNKSSRIVIEEVPQSVHNLDNRSSEECVRFGELF